MKNLAIISTQNQQLAKITYREMPKGNFAPEVLDDLYGAGCWVECYEDELPADFSIDTYTIIDGALVPASDEVIAVRAAAKIAEQNAAIRETRRQLYDDPNGECAPLYWDWQEAQSPEALAAWVAAKNKVRKQNPYVNAK